MTPKNCEVQGPDRADNLPKNSRLMGLWYWKYAGPHWTVCGIAPSAPSDRQIASVSKKMQILESSGMQAVTKNHYYIACMSLSPEIHPKYICFYLSVGL